MNNENFATKYRPRRFADIAGQLASLTKIEGALCSGKIPRTILISGPYGTGKTTIARLIGRYVNCVYGPKGCCADDACLGSTCPSCQLFDAPDAQHPDYMEANCGDARGIDATREMVQVATLSPRFKYRVLVLDEAQELTKQAASVLLKPLEEPPASTIWIICTTAKDKILPTLQSRCFNLPLSLVSAEDTRQDFARIMKGEAAVLDESVQDRIIEAAQGHPRNAVHGLEAALAYVAANQDLDPEALAGSIEQAVGMNASVPLLKYLAAVMSGKQLALSMVEGLQDPEAFLTSVLYGVNSILEAIACFRRADPQYTKLMSTCTRNPRHTDFGALRSVYVKAAQDVRQGFDGVGSVNAATAEALGITQAWQKVDVQGKAQS